jgi:SPP1 family predicted phage head-tail adaptor
MKAGDLRWQITIQQKTPSSPNPATGEISYTWSTFATVWADATPISRRGSRAAWEAVIAAQVKAQRVNQFDIRYIPGIDETMRVVDVDGRIWDIKSIIDVNTRHRELWLVCEAGLDQG